MSKIKAKSIARLDVSLCNNALRHCYFHHNENGILTANDPSVELLIEYSQFANNGAGDGYSHNIYVGYARKFTLRYSNIHHAKIGHNIKSRAAQNNILFNRIADGDNGTSSYAIDLPNGGLAHIMGNMIQQGKMTENPQIILAYGLLQAKKGVSALYQFKHVTIAHNIFINEQGSPDFIHLKGKPTTDIFNNIFQGRGQPVTSGD